MPGSRWEEGVMRSVEIEGTRQENASASFSEIAVPEKPDVKLFVQCLKSEGACSVAYRTAAWEKTVAIPFGESSTFPASNTREVLAAEIRPAFYRTPGDVEMTLRFFAVDPSEEKQTEAVDLSAEDVQVINGSIKGDIRKVDATTYEFVVAPSTSGASFAVFLRRDLSSTRGLPLRRGVLQGCIFDDEAPYLVNTQFLYDLLDESDAKTLRVSLNEPVTVSRIGGVTQSATEKPGYLNTFEVVATGTVSMISICDVGRCRGGLRGSCGKRIPVPSARDVRRVIAAAADQRPREERDAPAERSCGAGAESRGVPAGEAGGGGPRGGRVAAADGKRAFRAHRWQSRDGVLGVDWSGGRCVLAADSAGSVGDGGRSGE